MLWRKQFVEMLRRKIIFFKQNKFSGRTYLFNHQQNVSQIKHTNDASQKRVCPSFLSEFPCGADDRSSAGMLNCPAEDPEGMQQGAK